jgi:glutathione S-transferase
MLTFYYHPLSPIARRVWICLLEKQIPFQPNIVQLNQKEQFEPEFLALNPFHHVPVIVDGDVKLIESIAILDYLDRAYPNLPMTPNNPADLGKMRMVQMSIVNELMSTFPVIITTGGQIPSEHPKAKTLVTSLEFLQTELGDRPYFGGETINLADCVAGVTVPLIQRLGVDLSYYPQLLAWRDRLYDRPSWPQTEPPTEDFDRWRRWILLTIQRSTDKKS